MQVLGRPLPQGHHSGNGGFTLDGETIKARQPIPLAAVAAWLLVIPCWAGYMAGGLLTDHKSAIDYPSVIVLFAAGFLL